MRQTFLGSFHATLGIGDVGTYRLRYKIRFRSKWQNDSQNIDRRFNRYGDSQFHCPIELRTEELMALPTALIMDLSAVLKLCECLERI